MLSRCFLRCHRAPLSNVSRVEHLRHNSTFQNVEMGPPDPILGVTVAFRNDPSKDKLNLGVGAYRDDNGKPFVLDCVKKAEQAVISKNLNHEYSPIGGTPEFAKLAAQLLFGDDTKLVSEGKVASVQTLSGTGALRVAGEFLAKYMDTKDIYLPDPTWGNHVPIFKNSGLNIKTYPYYDGKGGLDFEAMQKKLNDAPNKSLFLFHACAHNPTGVDPSEEQWREIAKVCKAKGHVALLDSAYQGFASGNPERDAFACRHFVENDITVVATQSFAKNLGLYGERIGALHITADSPEEVERIMSQLLIVIRPNYSNPPVYGARLVEEILGNPELKKQWAVEVKVMADRIIKMRSLLVQNLKDLGSVHDWSHITNQIGMFCYSGLTAEQVALLKDNHSVYMTSNGRISMAGVTSGRVAYLAKAMHEVTK